MGFYADHIEPTLVSCLCGQKMFAPHRAQAAAQINGTVLEIGFGSGHNVPFYPQADINKLYALEPSDAMRRKAEKRVQSLTCDFEWLDLPGEQIPLGDESVDNILVTFTLCTIPDVQAALGGMRRVLRPGGKVAFLEHGRSPDDGVARWQDRLDGVWGKLAGGCHLNRLPRDMVEQAGFSIQQCESFYLGGMPKFAAWLSNGVAVK